MNTNVRSFAVQASTTKPSMFDVVAIYTSGKRVPVTKDPFPTKAEAMAVAQAISNDADTEYTSSASPYGVDHSVG